MNQRRINQQKIRVHFIYLFIKNIDKYGNRKDIKEPKKLITRKKTSLMIDSKMPI